MRMTKRIIPGGVRLQLALPTLVALLGLMGLIALAMIHITRNQLVDQSRVHVQSLAFLIGQEMRGCAPAESMTRMLQLRRHTGLALIGWHSPDGWILSTEDEELRTHVLVRERALFATRASSSTTVRTRKTIYQVSALRMPDAHPVVVGLSLDPLQARLTQANTMIWVYILINGLLIMILGYAVFTYVIVRPLRALGVATERAADGDFASPVTLLPRNEFGQLGRSFNSMLQSLEDQRAELRARIQELEETNLELKRTQDSLLRSEKLASVGQLAAGVAHEVGNPLQGVLGYAELLDDDDVDADMRQLLVSKIVKQVERIKSIIHELLRFSRDEVGQAIQPTDLCASVREAVDLASTTPRVKHLRLDLEGLDTLPHVQAVPSQVSQVIINLLFNAADALSSAGVSTPHIRLSATHHADAGRVRLCIEDNGPGIPPEVRARVFDPFFTTKPPGEGTGLGLPICLRIMERFGGGLDVEESALGGARFCLDFAVAGRDV